MKHLVCYDRGDGIIHMDLVLSSLNEDDAWNSCKAFWQSPQLRWIKDFSHVTDAASYTKALHL